MGGRATPGLLLFVLMVLGLVACRRDIDERPSDGQTVRPPDGHIDSILPIEEEIRRFRAKAPDTPTQLSGGAGSRDDLVRRWVGAIETRDSVALSGMLMNAAEYITFYYPESPYTRPPYRQSPAVRWSLITNTSLQGASRVWTRHAGLPMGYTGYRCNPEPEILGQNRIWTGCVVDWENGAQKGSVQLFGPIIERDGEFKFVTYASDY